MAGDFPRILTLLRKEKGISQKQAAATLGISQALLSHYEKGIRECRLDFVVTVANYYEVSCDYLLGRTADRQGACITADELPIDDGSDDKNFKGSVTATLNKKLIQNSVAVLFDQLGKGQCKALTAEAASFLTLAIYKVFRIVYSANAKNPEAMFALPSGLSSGLSTAAMSVCEAYMASLAKGESPAGLEGVENPECFTLSPQELAVKYPQLSGSLLSLISSAEAKMGFRAKK